MSQGLVAGAARIPLAPPLGLEMMGYALRQGRAEAVVDPLFARALYLRGPQDLLLVALDLCLIAPAQAREVRGRLVERTGVPAERIVVTCIHTHSAPETGLGAILAGRAAPDHVAPLLAAAVEAGAKAVAGAGPSRLGLGATALSIGRNRRREDGPVDQSVRILRVDRDDGAPLAIVWLHGCHPTVLGHENLAYSADWPGTANAAIEAALPGALSMFLLSAHADVDPRTRGLQDLARSNRSLGSGVEVMRAIGNEAGAAVTEEAARIETVRDVPFGAGAARVTLPVHGGSNADEGAAALAERRREALAALDLPADAKLRMQELYQRADERIAALPPDEARERVARVRLYLRDRSAPFFAGGRTHEVEVQGIRIGEARWLGLPLEPTVRVGLDWQARTGSRQSAVLSIANGWLRYLPHPQDFAEPPAHQGYEVLTSTFVPEGAVRLLEAGERVSASLGG